MGPSRLTRKDRRSTSGISSRPAWLADIFSKMKLFKSNREVSQLSQGQSNLVTTPSPSLTSVTSQGYPTRRPPPPRAALALIRATLDSVLPLPDQPRQRTWSAPEYGSEQGPIVANHGIASFATEVARRSPLMRRKQM